MDCTLEFLKEQKVHERLIRDVEMFRKEYAVEESELSRVNAPDMVFYGREVLEMAIAALLEGENRGEGYGKKRVGGKSCMDFWKTCL